MSAPLLSLSRLVKRYGGLTVTDNVSLDIQTGETHALIGPNGAGKTTLIAQLQGEIASNSGTIHFAGRDITRLKPHQRAQLGIARSFQITSVLPRFTAQQNVALSVQARLGHSFHFWRAGWGDNSLMHPALEALNLVGLEDGASRLARDLSHGQRRQLELAMALAMRPKLLLLDEPMAGMGRTDSARMTDLLATIKKSQTIVLVEHDMDTVFALADRVSVLVLGKVIATGTPAEIRNSQVVRDAYLGHGQKGAGHAA